VGITAITGGNGRWAAGAIYTHNLVECVHAADIPGEISVTLFVPAYRQSIFFLSGLSQHAVARYSHGTHDSALRKLAKGGLSLWRAGTWCSFERSVRRAGVNVVFPAAPFYCPRELGVTNIEWIPDFQHLHLPEFFPGPKLAARTEAIACQVKRAQHLIVSSGTALSDVEKHFPEALPRTSALPFVIFPRESWFATPPGLITRNRLGFDDYVMFPSQFWKHKNHTTLFEAIRILRDRGHANLRLVCTGREEDSRDPGYALKLREWIRDNDLQGRIIRLGLLRRHEQIQLMRQARVIVQPSRFEGWSALLEDSQMLGKLLVVSDIPVHREQNPPDASFFSPLDAEALADSLARKWSETAPGWNETREQNARQRQIERAVDFAHRFHRIVAEVVRSAN
jgi:glycosyltransferase involved in cell wall biosynthesis